MSLCKRIIWHSNNCLHISYYYWLHSWVSQVWFMPNISLLSICPWNKLMYALDIVLMEVDDNRTACIGHSRKTAILSCQRCLIDTGVEKRTTFKYSKNFDHQCLSVRVNVCIQTIVYIFRRLLGDCSKFSVPPLNAYLSIVVCGL